MLIYEFIKRRSFFSVENEVEGWPAYSINFRCVTSRKYRKHILIDFERRLSRINYFSYVGCFHIVNGYKFYAVVND